MAALGMITAAKGNMSYMDMATCLACCELGSLLPDIDTTSKISEEDIAFKAISMGLQGLGVKHRGLTHTVWASALFGSLFFVIALFMIGLMNSSLAFLLACIVFLVIHTDSGAYEIKKFGSIIAVGVYFGFPFIVKYLPQGIPAPSVSISISAFTVGMSVFWGCISHLVYDTANIQGIMWIHPFSKKRFHVLPITTSSGTETIFALVMTVLTIAWAGWIYKVGYFKLPF